MYVPFLDLDESWQIQFETIHQPVHLGFVYPVCYTTRKSFFKKNALTHDLISQFFLSLVPWLCQGPSCLGVSALTESYCRKTHPLPSLRSWCQLSLCRSWSKCNELPQRGRPWCQQARHTHSVFIPLVCFISPTALLTSWNHFVLLSSIWFWNTRILSLWFIAVSLLCVSLASKTTSGLFTQIILSLYPLKSLWVNIYARFIYNCP